MGYIILDETKRITAASFDGHCGENEIEVELPDIFTGKLYTIHDYRYVDGEFVYDPEPEPEQPTPEPTTNELIDALLGVG